MKEECKHGVQYLLPRTSSWLIPGNKYFSLRDKKIKKNLLLASGTKSKQKKVNKGQFSRLTIWVMLVEFGSMFSFLVMRKRLSKMYILTFK